MSSNISDLLYDADAREKMIKGVDVLADAVKLTLGPKGKNVAIFRPGNFPHLTKDGVSVANVINLRDPFENLGAQLVKEAAQRSAEVAGDGTTTSTVIAHKLLHDGKKFADSGSDVRRFVSGIEQATADILERLSETRVEVTTRDELEDVATISANGEKELGKIIADAIDRVTEDGAISIEKARGFETELNIVDGTSIDRGFISPYFATDQAKGIAELDDALVFVCNTTISAAKDILPVLEHSAKLDRPLLIIANDVTSEALQTLVLNNLKCALKVCAVKAPEFGSARTVALQDMAALLNATVVAGLSREFTENPEEFLGRAKKVVVEKNASLFVGVDSNLELLKEKTEETKRLIEDPLSTDSDREVARRRLRRLSDGVAVIKVGGATEIEMLERKDRIEDAMYAARAAKRGGIQPGGGTALISASKNVGPIKRGSDAYEAGYQALLNACEAPLYQIAKNAGEIPEIVVGKIKKSRKPFYGFNASDGGYCDMLENGIIDPHLVVCSSLKHAASVACNILLVGCSIALTDEISDDGLGIIENL